MSKDVVRVQCECCRGTGRRELTGEYYATLVRLRQLGGEQSGAALARDMGVKPTAMNNRLAALERMGLATSRVYGRQRLFVAKKVKAGAA